MILKDVIAELSTGSSLTALIGARFFEAAPPPDLTQYPCIALTLVGGSSSDTIDGADVYDQRLEISAYALDFPTADAIRTAVIRTLSGWYGPQSDQVNILNTHILNPGTDMVSEDRVFRCLVEFHVLYCVLS